MRDNADDKRSRFYILEVAIIAAVALLFTVSLTPHQGAPTSAQSPAALARHHAGGPGARTTSPRRRHPSWLGRAPSLENRSSRS